MVVYSVYFMILGVYGPLSANMKYLTTYLTLEMNNSSAFKARQEMLLPGPSAIQGDSTLSPPDIALLTGKESMRPRICTHPECAPPSPQRLGACRGHVNPTSILRVYCIASMPEIIQRQDVC